MTDNRFVGTWRLVSWEAETRDGQRVHPFGEDAEGWIMYDASGNVSVHLMRRERPRFVSEDPLGGTAEEIEAAFSGYLAYCGRYTVHNDAGTINHSLRGASFPNWVGSEQLRHFEFAAGTLTLRTPPIAEMSHVLTWRRVSEKRSPSN